MKIVPSLRYQVRDCRNAIIVYYGVVIAMVLLNLLCIPLAGNKANFTISSGGITAVTGFFAGVLSLCAFKDSFLLHLQHGVSRRTQFLARLGALGIISAVLAVSDEIYTLLLKLLGYFFPGNFFSASFYEILYSTDVTRTADGAFYSILTTPATIVLSIVFSFFYLLAVSSLAYLISVLNFRLNKVGKIIFWVGWPFLLVFGGAFFDYHPEVANAFVGFIATVSRVCLSTLPRLCLTCLVLTAIFSGLTWLLMRRTHIK